MPERDDSERNAVDRGAADPGVALIVGAGPGFSGSVARKLAARGMSIALASRKPKPQEAEAIAARSYAFDAGDAAATARLFAEVERDLGPPSFVMYNPSARVRAPLVDLVPDEVERAIRVTAFGGFLVAQEAVKRMLPLGGGRILLTGATASVKGMPQSAAFAMGKFALRGLAQSMARELQPQGIHTLHVVIDGAIASPARTPASPDAHLDPDAIADAALAALDLPRSAWSWETEVRPWVERF
ncbi:oxidoreductase [Acuticoccus sediminis]|uniref:Oxidoreductase n=1 Tax=Acuticoccus sediminis TaxID=2184697 RepID=A0A8B2NXP3_9HYPH|nr:SDR family NAD(P)-dependent oxidoreductase [Acuticoccus sediminis]RAI03460.1 oxidoreductase [Acuticoccus sediminis]